MSAGGQNEGHVAVPMLAIGSLALVLAAGFVHLGIMERADDLTAAMLESGGLGEATKRLPAWGIWTGAACGAYGVAAAILTVPGTWRRVVLWVTALVVVAGWGPVLALASHRPETGVALLATFWSGLCSVVYAGRHHMAADDGKD